MGAQWKHAGRVSEAARKGVVFGKLAKEIAVAAKLGDPNPENNPRLRAAVEEARKSSMPRDTIERAIKKGAGLLDDEVQYETLLYEGFTPHGVPIIVECLTDNKNRTAADVRILFRKGQLGGQGSVVWMFDRVGLVEISWPKEKESKNKVNTYLQIDPEGIAIELGAQNFEVQEDSESGKTIRLFTDLSDLDSVARAATQAEFSILKAEPSYEIKNPIVVSEDQRKEIIEFLSALDDHDDVQKIYVGLG